MLQSLNLFRTEQHRLSRCDLARGWWPNVAGVKETPVAAADDRLHSRQWLFTPLRQSQVKKYYGEAARWTGTPNDYREIKEAESIIA
ncbi:hypothetical protein T03_18137 [Trichinella britovi]|uniref:Uncharacterized protein n=1 Tax=Trichinella britovi TaxID=45882 RepID=A0A0V1C4I3_TRIBR|nr:hypothetical protein T03_18137 [Trichinella britovi]